MRVLIYNWDVLDGINGGGVVTYIKNLINGLLDNNVDVIFVNSGLRYTKDRILRIEKTNNSYGDKVNSYEVINSPVIAPSRQSAKNVEKAYSDVSLKKLFKGFLLEQGPFDVIHFNNLEGISIRVLELRKEFQNTKFLYSAHNYYPVCSRVNLWKNEKTSGGESCQTDDYYDCIECYKKHKYSLCIWERESTDSRLKSYLCKIGNLFFHDKETEEQYKTSIATNVNYINKYIDIVIAVSKRVKEILVSRGIAEKCVQVSYIGTAVAEKQLGYCIANPFSEYFTIAYMGYMRRMKGIDYFLDFIESIPETVSVKCKIKIIARYNKTDDAERLKRINRIREKFKEVEVINGYTKDNQANLLSDVNLGVVPVLWEDNLPQVAIEQVAFGVPILTSNLGGAQEVANNGQFIFDVADANSCLRKFLEIYKNRELLHNFFNTSMRLITMDEHINEIMKMYG